MVQSVPLTTELNGLYSPGVPTFKGGKFLAHVVTDSNESVKDNFQDNVQSYNKYFAVDV